MDEALAVGDDDLHPATALVAGAAGQTLTSFTTKYGANLNFSADYSVSITTTFTVHAFGESLQFDPNKAPPDASTPLRRLRGQKLSGLEIRDPGKLWLIFDDGTQIEAGVGEHDSWEINGPNDIHIVGGARSELFARGDIPPSLDPP